MDIKIEGYFNVTIKILILDNIAKNAYVKPFNDIYDEEINFNNSNEYVNKQYNFSLKEEKVNDDFKVITLLINDKVIPLCMKISDNMYLMESLN